MPLFAGSGGQPLTYLRPDQSTAVQLIAMVVPVASGLAFVMVAATAVFYALVVRDIGSAAVYRQSVRPSDSATPTA